MTEPRLPLLQKLLTDVRGKVEYGLHVAWPPDEKGRVAEDFQVCPSQAAYEFRFRWWTQQGCTCTRLTRVQSTTAWTRDAEVSKS